MNYDDWFRLYREEEDYEYLEYVDIELKRIRRQYYEDKVRKRKNNE